MHPYKCTHTHTSIKTHTHTHTHTHLRGFGDNGYQQALAQEVTNDWGGQSYS